jgi:hypothetical protein
MRKALFRGAAIAAAVSLFTGVSLANQPTTPEWFPNGFTLDSTAYTLRFPGVDRYQTAGIISLIHSNAQEDEDYPFNWVDNEDPDANNHTWGLDVCTDAGDLIDAESVDGVGIAAGDTSADALAASPAKDLDPLPAGNSVTDVDDTSADMDDAFMLLTNSTREGATSLNANVVAAILKMKDETTCDDFDVVIFGREEAVPTAVYDDLDAINGDGDVFVIGGVDRYETAQKIGTNVFFANGLPELDHYPTAQSATFDSAAAADNPTTLSNVVFLAEGVTGADALTIGPVAASNNAPVFLTETNNLPSFTSSALATTNPDTIVVLGGTDAISASTATAAAAAAPGDETVIRIGGTDRWETSVLISEQLFGYYGENQGEDTGVADAGTHFDNLAIGFGRSEGAGAAFVGWPDVLASAWFIDEYDDVNDSTPLRGAPDWDQNEDYTFIGGEFWSSGDQSDLFIENSDNDTPLLVVQQGSVPPSVDDYLESLWTDPDVEICNADPDPGEEGPPNGPGTCNNEGGFGFTFGGTAAIAASTEVTIAGHLSGGTYDSTDRTPTQNNGLVFYTELDFSEYDPSSEDDGGPLGFNPSNEPSVCWYRNALTGSQFGAVFETDGDFWAPSDDDSFAPFGQPDHQVDYQNTEMAFPRYQSRFWCVDAPGVGADPDLEADAFGQSLSGHRTVAVKNLGYNSDSVTLESIDQGLDIDADTYAEAGTGAWTEQTDGESGTSIYVFSSTEATGGFPWDFRYKATTHSDADWQLELTISRKDPEGGADGGTTEDDADRFTATGILTVETAAGVPIFIATLTMEGFDEDCPNPAFNCIRLSGMYSIGSVLGGIRLTVGTVDETGGSDVDDLFDMMLSGNA